MAVRWYTVLNPVLRNSVRVYKNKTKNKKGKYYFSAFPQQWASHPHPFQKNCACSMSHHRWQQCRWHLVGSALSRRWASQPHAFLEAVLAHVPSRATAMPMTSNWLGTEQAMRCAEAANILSATTSIEDRASCWLCCLCERATTGGSMSMHQSTETQGWFSPSYSLHPHERFGVQTLCIRSIRTDNRGGLDSPASQVLARPLSDITSKLILYQSVKSRLVK